MKKTAFIDIGSNSFTLVICEYEEETNYRIIDVLKKSVRLGDMNKKGFLSDEKISLAIETLKMFKNLCVGSEVNDIKAVATEAVRKAKNQEEFLLEVKKETDIEITVLTGEMEAFYDYLGVMNTMDAKDGILMDIGGSSTEIVYIKNKKIKESVSLPFGAITITRDFDLKDKLTKKQEEDITEYVIKQLNSVKWMKSVKEPILIGVGGSIRNIGKIHRKRVNYMLNLEHNYKLGNEQVFEIFDLVKSKTFLQRKNVRGLSESRVDIIVGALTAVVATMKYFKTKDMLISGKGLRDGLIYERVLGSKIPMNNPLNFSINNILINNNLKINHANQIYQITKALYYFLEDISEFEDEKYDRILKSAAFLHDCGININYDKRKAHSAYLILNIDINGMNHNEIIQTALAIDAEENGDIKKKYFKYKKMLDKKDIENLKKLSILLRIAESLDRSATQSVKAVSCEILDDKFKVGVQSDRNIDFEIKDAMNYNDIFASIFKIEMEIYKI
ncbi:Ppx/GppA phosphatase family protein [Clostridium grantii]|uniref:Exopolyphosphatase / guanosine-5'-triphosphate,3'-diphosphate pyrophosphatase n=1 Tax=Clostridium grantii DSM 8605 TaxID=1121316 RepID=A0A1M5UIL1_9CLOT|nr:Ppx/GppA phosphatase family protein [Clostridium grantii]SHH62483.1 exopolyphosphatase / guanosine-5'-triphosphate,3'-diphosphate pyrophosphatase [Clostridium grantii DSM 8605]